MSEQSAQRALAESFQKHGYATGIPVFSEAEVRELRTAVEAIFDRFEKPRDTLRQLHLFFPWALDILRREAVAGPVSDILGPDVLGRAVMVLVKHPYSPSVVLWHSDHAYTQKGSSPQLSAWIALSPSFPENGCMKVAPGTHRELHAHHEVQATGHQLYKNLTVVHPPTPDSVVDLRLEPGQMSLHDPMILHASGPNETDVPRIGFIIRYTTPAYAPDNIPTVRIRGNAPCPHLNIVEPVFAQTPEERLEQLIAYNLNFQVNGHS